MSTFDDSSNPNNYFGLDFAFHAAKKRGEQLDLTSKPMMAMTKNDPTEVIPKETFSGLKKV